MQAIAVLGLITIISVFGVMEVNRNSAENFNEFSQLKAQQVAGNIRQYNDLVEQFAVANYDLLHIIDSQTPGHAESIRLINYVDNKLANYSQKGFQPFFNYQSVVFNYARLSAESYPLPTLYMATSWNKYLTTSKGYLTILLPEVMGATNQLFSKRLYQGNSTYWAVPLLLRQNNCQVIEIYSQVPNDVYGASQLNKAKTYFSLLCNDLQQKSSFKFLDYVYLAPILK